MFLFYVHDTSLNDFVWEVSKLLLIFCKIIIKIYIGRSIQLYWEIVDSKLYQGFSISKLNLVITFVVSDKSRIF